MRHNPERLAWTILIAAFLTFCALIIGIPLSVRWYVLNARIPNTARLTRVDGTVLVDRPDQPGLDAVTAFLDRMTEGSVVATDASSEGVIEFLDPRNNQVLATLQVFSDSELILRYIRSPRFKVSPLKHRIVIVLNAGRIRSRVSANARTDLTVETPHGLAIFDQAGNYSVEVYQDETTVVVREGVATVTAEGESVTLDQTGAQRTIIRPGEPPLEGLPAARNLIVNGDFTEGLEPAWTTRTQKEVSDQPDPTITVSSATGRTAVHFNRPGEGLNWAYAGIRQEINRDVRELSSLRLHLAVRIQSQDLFACGALGTECPVMVKIVYQDTEGATYEWLKGFYSNPDPSGRTPAQCVTCPPPTSGVHMGTTPGNWRTYDSPNLIQVFRQAGIPAASIIAIEIYASGHAYESLVSEVELLAEE